MGPSGAGVIALVMLLFIYVKAATDGNHCDPNCLNPRRPQTEEAFFAMEHHERTMTQAEMDGKLQTIAKRRGEDVEWANRGSTSRSGPNILLILADDLGYGDLSVAPFKGIPIRWTPQRRYAATPSSNISTDYAAKRDMMGSAVCNHGEVLTPNLERMAKKGIKATNFHAAAPVCSPSRVSIMTGLYPWRLGALNAFELGADLKQRNGFLPQVPTGPEIFREHGYYTAHSGKWHMGGMREENRVDRAHHDTCLRPGPNQHGFQDAVSALDGPESPRYTFLQRNLNQSLHSYGYRHCLKNDVPMPIPQKKQILSDKEASDAINMITQITEQDRHQPWYMQVWFNAPHGPWELLKEGEEVYTKHYGVKPDFWKDKMCGTDRLRDTRAWMYKSMVTAMDKSIGSLLDTVERLGIEKDTLIFFTSDNGPENNAGHSGPYQERKRSLLEGGVRVPAIWQWTDTLAAGSSVDTWGSTVDIFPTFLEASHIPKPENVNWDGLSLWAALKGTAKGHREEPKYAPQSVQNDTTTIRSDRGLVAKISSTTVEGAVAGTEGAEAAAEHPHAGHHWGRTTDGVSYNKRLHLWHKVAEKVSPQQDRCQSSGWYDDLKLTTSSYKGCLDRVFDHRIDPTERLNLLTSSGCTIKFGTPIATLRADFKRAIGIQEYKKFCAAKKLDRTAQLECVTTRHSHTVDRAMKIWLELTKFVTLGNTPMITYQKERYDKAICKVPNVSDLPAISYHK